MRLHLILIFFLFTSLTSCKKKTEILAGFLVGSDEKIWKENLRIRKQLEKQQKEEKKTSIYFDLYNQDLLEILVFGEDTLVAQYKINEPLKTGRLRNLDINLNGYGETKDSLGYRHLKPVRKNAVLKFISILKDNYGSIDSTFSDKQGKLIVAEFANYNLLWLDNGTVITFGYNNFKKEEGDSTSYGVYLRIKCANYDQIFSEDLASFKKSHHPEEILKLDFGKTSVIQIADNKFKLIQLYDRFTHNDLGYENTITSIKFDVSYRNKFKEEVLRIPNIEFNFHDEFPSNAFLPFDWSKERIGFDRTLSNSEIKGEHGDLKPQLSNLKILYSDGDVY